MAEVPKEALEAVLVDSAPIPANSIEIRGMNFEGKFGMEDLINSFKTTGFQASNLGLAIDEVNRMIDWRLSDDPLLSNDPEISEEERTRARCTIWLSFTSNMISSGLREAFVYLAKHKLVDVFVTSAGGIEEDFIKCLSNTYLGSFNWKGKELRDKGWNRIGNLFVPNDNYCRFEDWLQPILDDMLLEQQAEGEQTFKGGVPTETGRNEDTPFVWTPSMLIDRLGREINDERSLYYWCHKNSIPVFCPGITDGSLGDNLYFHSYRNPGLVVDVIQDIRRINDLAVRCRKSGMIILGGGLAKHHTCNANLMRNGSDYAVYINTGQEYDGSDSGAKPDEAISWGKIKADAQPVKVHADATIVFPMIVAATFAKKK